MSAQTARKLNNVANKADIRNPFRYLLMSTGPKAACVQTMHLHHVQNARLIRDTLCATEELEAEKANLESEMSVLVEMTQTIVSENARVAQDQEDYQKRYNELVGKYNKAKSHFDAGGSFLVVTNKKK